MKLYIDSTKTGTDAYDANPVINTDFDWQDEQ